MFIYLFFKYFGYIMVFQVLLALCFFAAWSFLLSLITIFFTSPILLLRLLKINLNLDGAEQYKLWFLMATSLVFQDIETELGLTREQLIRIALLLGSDYTEGIR